MINNNVHKLAKRGMLIVLSSLMFLTQSGFTNLEAEKANESTTFYEFTKDNRFDFEVGKKLSKYKTIGEFSVDCDMTSEDDDNLPIYDSEEPIGINYIYDYKEPDKHSDQWYISKDDSKKVNQISLGDEIGNGTLILQISKDQKNWVTQYIENDLFKNNPKRNEAFYTISDVELNAGCYYRVIVAYKLEKYLNTTKKFFILNQENTEKKWCSEVYEFYAYNSNAFSYNKGIQKKYSLGKKVLCKDFDSYYGEKELKKDDIHYNWELGNFFITGQTGNTLDNENNPVILKNVNDRVTLWFNLAQNINELNGDKKLSITSDEEASDQYFETENQYFGKGTLIIRKTNEENVKQKPQIYTNYLDANTLVGADTVVQLFEEGDYEVALDYEVTKDQLIDVVHHYRIFFKFSVRNSNCMVYPLDVDTNEKIINGSYSKDGFYLDLAKSKYLQLNVKKSDLKDGTYELVEDTTYNQLAKENDRFTEEGLYEITVTNRYTNISDVKRIYVGDNDILKTYAVTGLSMKEIKEKVASGAIINEDGTIFTDGVDTNTPSFAGLDDDDLLEYVENNVYLNTVSALNSKDYFVENVQAKYISKDYFENLTANSKDNLYFGYNAKELDDLYESGKYVFTLSDNGTTKVERIEKIEDKTTENLIENVAVGTGVILVCVTVSSLTAINAPAVSVILAASATTGTSFGLSSAALGGVSAAVVKGYQTGDFHEALKAGVKGAGEGFKFGAISGSMTGGATTGFKLFKATKGGLNMNQVALIQKESKLPLDTISQIQTMDQYEYIKKKGMETVMVGKQPALVQKIDLNYKDEFGFTNLQRMKNGESPIALDGSTYELHHLAQNPNGTLAILTEKEHRSKEMYKLWHSSTDGAQKKIADWSSIKKQFWKDYAKMYGGDL